MEETRSWFHLMELVISHDHGNCIQVLVDAGVDMHSKMLLELTPFHYGCFVGTVNAVKAMLQLPQVEVNETGPMGTPLQIASRMGAVEVVEVLLAAGADVHCAHSNLTQSLHHATANDQLEVAKLLIEAGADVNCRNCDGVTPLMFASAMSMSIVEFLLQQPAIDVNAETTVDGFSALSFACGEGTIDVVCKLIEHGADVHHSTKNKITPLLLAAERGHREVVKLLLSRDPAIDTDAVSVDGTTPLIAAATHGHVGIVQYLLEAGADVSGGGRFPSPLHFAAQNSRQEVAQLLLDAGAEVIWNPSPTSPLALACCRSENIEIVRLLLDHPDTDPSAVCQDNETPLMIACSHGHQEIASLLVSAGANVSTSRTSDAVQALHFAAQGGHVQLIELLVDGGADVNCVREENRTPLMLAVASNRIDAVKRLVDLGADVNRLSSTNESALVLSTRHKSLSMMELLVDGETPQEQLSKALQKAVLWGHVDGIRWLMRHGGEKTRYSDGANATLLHCAAYQNYVDVVKLLLECGMDGDSADDDGCMPLHIAAEWNHIEIAKLLIQHVGPSFHSQQEGTLKTPAHRAAYFGNTETLQLFLDTGVDDVDSLPDYSFPTLLMEASKQCQVETMAFLLDRGADVNATDFTMSTPLHFAAEFCVAPPEQKRLRKGAQLLVSRGAHVEALNADDQTPLEVAAKFGNLDMMRFLLFHAGARLGNALHDAVEHDQLAAVDFLLREGVDIDSPSSACGGSPLHYAARDNNESIVSKLVAYGADVNVIDKSSKTPLLEACLTAIASPNIISTLLANGDASVLNTGNDMFGVSAMPSSTRCPLIGSCSSAQHNNR